jgi:hypothetical protein
MLHIKYIFWKFLTTFFFKKCNHYHGITHLVIEIRFIKYRFLKSRITLRGKKRSTIAYPNNPTFLSAISAIIFHAKTSQTDDIPTKLWCWIPWAWKGHVVPTKSKYADSKSSAYLRGTRLKTKKYQTVILAYLRYVSTRIIAPWNFIMAMKMPLSLKWPYLRWSRSFFRAFHWFWL